MTGNTKKIRVRAAPSPTGYMHVGTLRTCIYDFLLAKKLNGDFILRIEDTDQARTVSDATVSFCRTLKRIGLEPNEGVWLDDDGVTLIERGEYGPYIQSERQAKHLEYAKQLMDMDKAYYCFCSEDRLKELRQTQELMKQPTGYDGHCRNIPKEEAAQRVAAGEDHVIRLKLPREGKAIVKDAIRGEVAFDWKLVDDQVIIKHDGMATYHLAAMCDDHDMEITHVLRGEEWLSSAPKHIFIYEAFGWEQPVFAHLPLLLNPDRSKLSKRQGDVSAESYLDKGYLPQAILNFLALCGWNPKDDQEVYSLDELAPLFDLSKVNKAGAIFNLEKLNWLNAYYMKQLTEEEYLKLVELYVKDATEDAELKRRALLLVRDRLVLPGEATEQTKLFFADKMDFSQAKITWKTQEPAETRERLEAVKALIASWDTEYFELGKGRVKIESTIKQMITDKGWGNGDTLWPTRVALSGQEKSPSPFELIEALGKERSVKRLEDAINHLG